MGFSFDISIPVIAVFVQGLVSFLSPCVLPLLPLYLGYLSGGTAVIGKDGQTVYNRKKVMINTLFFVVGISFAFFLLGFGASAIGVFFNSKHAIFARIGGILIVLFGLYQIGMFGKSMMLERERKLPFNLNKFAMSPVVALILGFTFSFAWTPCVGPALTSVLLMTASAATTAKGFMLIAVYTLGFVLPFMIVGIFTTSLLKFFAKYKNVVKYTVKVGGIIMIIIGLLMFTGKMNDVTGYLSKMPGVSVNESSQNEKDADGKKDDSIKEGDKEEKKEKEENTGSGVSKEKSGEGENSSDKRDNDDTAAAIDFALKDQYGKVHKLKDYKGKTIFLNFWATWCPPCRKEMPDIQQLHEYYSQNESEDVVILGVAAPGYGQEGSEADVSGFLEDNGYTYPVLMDNGAELFEAYGIYSYPTTFMIDKDGNVFGYVTGMMSKDVMKSIIRQTVDGK